MKIFIDTALTSEIKEASSYLIISGVTTNPTLLMKSGRSLHDVISEIINIVDGPISAEVDESSEENMYQQAKELVKNIPSDNLTIKLPMTIDGIKVCKRLSKEGIKTNVTLIFTVSQALLAMEAGATFISPFMGRIDDFSKSDHAGYDLIKDIVEIRNNGKYQTKIIAASIRNVNHVKQALLANADIATIPFKVLKEMYLHPLTTSGLETFKHDSEKKN